MDRDTWEDDGRQLAEQYKRNGQWEIGEWLNAFLWGGKYDTAQAIFGLSRGTLKNYASVAKKFPASRRRTSLTFEHHVAVAALPESEQDRLLARAEDERLTARALRDIASPPQRRTLTLDVSAATLARWRSASADANVETWLIETANAAASA
jgi:hypothetical protein